MTQEPRTFDLFTMPVEGVAAYWLSLHRLAAGKKNFADIVREAGFAADPFTSYLLDLTFGGRFDDESVVHLADTRGETMMGGLKRRLECMRLCILDVTGGDNPRRTYTRMAALFPVAPVSADAALAQAQALLKDVMGGNEGDEPAEAARQVEVSHLMPDAALIASLLFFVLLARRHSKMAARPLMRTVGSRYFSDGMLLVIDGFDEAFVRRWLRVNQQTALAEMGRKMEMSVLMALAVRGHKEYDDVYRIARAYLP